MKTKLEQCLFYVTLAPFGLWILLFLSLLTKNYLIIAPVGLATTIGICLAPVTAILYCIVCAVRRRFRRSLLIPLGLGLLSLVFAGIIYLVVLLYMFYF